MCRCGGIIKVVQNGSWVNISKGRIEGNIIDLLKFAEDRIYGDYIKCLGVHDDPLFSKIKAYNIVHGILLYATGLKEAKPGYIINEKCEKAKKPAPHIEIKIKPAKDVLKQAKYREVGTDASILILGKYFPLISMGFTIYFGVGEIIESAEVLSRENINNFQSLIDIPVQILKESGKIPNLESLAYIGGLYGMVVSCFNIFESLVYNSYADFTGEIDIIVSTYCEEYKFTGTYNIFGDLTGDYTADKKPIQQSPFLNYAPSDNNTVISYKIYEDGIIKYGKTNYKKQ